MGHSNQKASMFWFKFAVIPLFVFICLILVLALCGVQLTQYGNAIFGFIIFWIVIVGLAVFNRSIFLLRDIRRRKREGLAPQQMYTRHGPITVTQIHAFFYLLCGLMLCFVGLAALVILTSEASA